MEDTGIFQTIRDEEFGMRVLVACEYSGKVRDAFAALGHDAMSCDLLPTDSPGNHYQGDVFDIINDGWDLMIAHPPCTDLAVSGANTLLPNRPMDDRLLPLILCKGCLMPQLPRLPWRILSASSAVAFVSLIKSSSLGCLVMKPQRQHACG